MMKTPSLPLLVALCCASFALAEKPLPSAAQIIDIASGDWDNIVNIEVATLNPDYREPWNAGQPSGGSGTGWMVAPNKFVTNAHVVSNGSRLLIRTSNDPEPHLARVIAVGHDCDLAMIEAIDAKPFEKLKPLPVSDAIPSLNSEVSVIGYPMGGERISVTRGVVSRIDFQPYSHTGVDSHLTVQVDAAINPGNSGGPVLQDGKVVGVAFQGYSGRVAQNVGYMIPVPVVQRFLNDVKDGKYDHYVDFAINDFPIENPAMRTALGLPNDGIGVMIADIEPVGSAAGVLQSGDVLLRLDGNPILSNGLMKVDGQLVDKNEVVERKFAGDKVKLDFIRDGKPLSAEMTLKRFDPYVKLGEQHDVRPRYVTYGGLVFQPMDRNLMDAHNIREANVNYVFDNYLTKKIYVDHPEVIILTQVLPDEVNSYVQNEAPGIVEEINGVPIKTLKDVPTALATKTDKPDHVVVKLWERGRPLVLKRALADAAKQRIMKNYGMAEDAYLGE
jgi:S1-C subfamily serine protease